MRCPYCGSEDTRVSDSRPVEENNSIRRRRVCDACKRRFTTYEKIETIPMVVVKKDNNREPYDRSKIEGGILRACHKRPVSINQIKRVVDEIEKERNRRIPAAKRNPDIGKTVIITGSFEQISFPPAGSMAAPCGAIGFYSLGGGSLSGIL